MAEHRFSSPRRVLLAFDKFKGTLTSREAAHAAARGIVDHRSNVQVTTIPIADGGDGTIDAAIDAGYEARCFTVTGPIGDGVDARVAISGRTAIVEVADICGLGQLPTDAADPLRTTSHGVGEMLLELADLGISDVVLGLGGSATTDGGTGMLAALGVAFRDASGEPLAPGGGDLSRLDSVDWTSLDSRVRQLDLTVASDVDNPLLGPAGAARIFGPQKGARPDDVADLEAGLERLVTALERSSMGMSVGPAAETPGGGAAGGLGFGAYLLGAETASGAKFVLDLLGLRDRLAHTDLVVTGEGRLDMQSLRGKAPIEVVRAATEVDVPVVAAVGQCTLTTDERAEAGFAALWAMSEYDSHTALSSAASSSALSVIGGEIAEAVTSAPQPEWNAAQHELHDAIRHHRSGAAHETSWELQCPC